MLYELSTDLSILFESSITLLFESLMLLSTLLSTVELSLTTVEAESSDVSGRGLYGFSVKILVLYFSNNLLAALPHFYVIT